MMINIKQTKAPLTPMNTFITDESANNMLTVGTCYADFKVA